MADVPYDFILRSIEHIMQCNCEVCHTQTSPQVPSCTADIENDVFPELLAQLLELPPVEVLDVHWIVDCVQQGRDWLVAGGWVKVIQLVH